MRSSSLCYNFLVQYTAYKGGRLISQKGGDAHGGQRCTFLSLMFMFGMFILALLTYMKKK
ncbi:hypothetical protein C7121_04960 [Paenibacillus glucanolyticus]|nr:hypothetical protein C7121_04960 [Paenibacillus glucanolyticus]MPY15873.1 hypothetical protein [Paenibacillus glucanolyticus]